MKEYRKKGKTKIYLVAVTGTPGTGKSRACKLIKEYPVIDLNEIIKKHAKKLGYDSYRESIEVTRSQLRKMLPKIETTTIVEGHLSYLLDPDIAIVLRCSPKILARRLKGRSWPKYKIRENQEAEAIDVILIETMVMQRTKVFEIDTTDMKPKEVAEAIRGIIEGKKNRKEFKPGRIDWSKEVMDWY